MLAVFARLGHPGQHSDLTPFDRWARATCCLAIALYLLHGGYAALTHRALYGDAAWFLVRIMTEGDVTSFYSNFAREFYYSRFLAYALTQLPTVAAVHLGVEDASMLSWVLGATYFVHKPLSLWLCYRLLPAGRKSYALFPLLGLFAGTINSELYIVTETHLAVSFLWPLLLAITQLIQPTRGAFALVAIGLLTSAFVYESMAFFGPVLLALCVFRAAYDTVNRNRWLALAGCALVPIAISAAAILYPRDPTNKSAFSNGILKLLSDTMADPGTAHVVGVVSLVAVAVIALLLIRGLIARAPKRVPHWSWLVSLLLASLPAIHFFFYADRVDFTYSITDRGFGGLLMQLVIVALYLLTLVLPSRAFASSLPAAAIVVSGLAVGQVAWQWLATRAWSASVRQLESAALRHDGLQECGQATLGYSIDQPAAADVICHWWVLPLTVVLAPEGKVRTLFVSQEPFLPFDPRNPAALPNSADRAVDYSQYLRGYAAAREVAVPQHLDFSEKGSGTRQFRGGFSKPEAWATWTDASKADLELCFERDANSAPMLVFKVAPQVTAIRPRLAVVVHADGEAVGTWNFQLGEGVVERRLAIPQRLVADHCTMLTFAFDDDRRASELGVPNDPRRLGLAFLSLQVQY